SESTTWSPDSSFTLVEKGLVLKPYPCCRALHRCIEAILALKSEYQISAENVSEVICKTSAIIRNFLPYSRPKTGLQGKFSMQYCMAIALLDGSVGIRQFTDERANKPDIQALIGKVKYGPDKSSREEPEEVTVRLRGGREYTQAITIAKGDPENPMTEAEVAAKFRNCSGSVLAPSKREQALEYLSRLETLARVSELMDALRPD
ncbi:MmgE/PrpD family protein, partial [Chloroflexota bacterium]